MGSYSRADTGATICYVPAVCSEPNCPVVLDRAGYCDDHRRGRLRQAERRRPSPRERGYDSAWRRARAAYLRTHRNCERCGARAVTVHHKALGPLELGANDPKNLEALCESCHGADSGRRRWA